MLRCAILSRPGFLAQFAAIALGLAAVSSSAFADDKASPPTDGSGDLLPKGAVARLGTLHWRHASNVSFVAFADDGKQLLTSCGDGIIHVWDAQTGKELRNFGKAVAIDPKNIWTGPLSDFGDAYVYSWVTASPDGKLIVTADDDGKIRIWDVAAGKELRSFEHDHPRGLVDLVLTADKKQVITRGDTGRINLWDVETAKLNREIGVGKGKGYQGIDRTPSYRLAVSADGKFVADDWIRPSDGPKTKGEFRVWELKDGKVVQKIEGKGDLFGIPQTASPAFSADGKRLAWVSPQDFLIHIHDVAPWKEVQKLDPKDWDKGGIPQPATLRFSPDGKTLAVLDQGEILRLFDVASGKIFHEPREEPPCFDGFHPSLGNLNGVVGALIEGSLLAWAPDGKRIVQAWGHQVRFWDTETGKGNDLDGGHFGEVTGLLVAADGKTLHSISRDNTVRRWNVPAAKEEKRFALPEKTREALLVDAGQVVIREVDANYLYDLKKAERLVTFDYKNGSVPKHVCCSSDGTTCATITSLASIQIWDQKSGKKTRDISDLQWSTEDRVKNHRVPFALASSSDGSLLAVRYDETGPRWDRLADGSRIRLYHTPSGNLLWQADVKVEGCRALHFSDDNRSLALINGEGDGVTLIETATGKERARSKAPGFAFAFSMDGHLLAVGALDGSVKVLRLHDGKEIAGFQGHPGRVSALAFSADMTRLFSGGTEGTVLVWDIAEAARAARQPAEVDADTARKLWAELADADAAKAYQAVMTLSAAPNHGTALLKEVMKPMPPADADHIKKLIEDLDSNDFDTREKASKGLAKLEHLAEPALRKALDAKPPLEMSKRIEELLQALAPGKTPLTADALREIRAIEVLELIGTPEARAVLETLAHGAEGALFTREAAAALKRLAALKAKAR